MIAVFTTNVRDQIRAQGILKMLEQNFPGLNINFDLDSPEAPYPCGHTILRAEGAAIHSESIQSAVIQSGFMCAVLEDKVCS